VRKHQGHLDDAERLLRESLVIREKALGHEDTAVARGLFDLATILGLRGKSSEAEAAFRESLALREKLLAGGDTRINASTVAMTMNGLGMHLTRTGKFAEAEKLIRRALDLYRRTGDYGYAYAESLLALGRVLSMENRLAEAEAVDRQGLESLKKFVEPDDHRIVEATEQLAGVVRAEGR